MGEIVNLRRVRKRRDREAEAAEAAANRALHGRTRAERETQALRRDQGERRLDGARLQTGEAPED